MNTFALPSSFLVLVLALLWIVSSASRSETLRSGDTVGRHAISLQSLLPYSYSCSTSSDNKGAPTRPSAADRKATVPLIRRGSLGDRCEDRRDYVELLRLDNQRVAYIQSKVSGGVIEGKEQSLASANLTLPAMSGTGLGIADYVINVGLGTPMMNLTLIFDTGSDLVWTQCQPCDVYCYDQVDPIFNPAQSSSYENVSCSSTTCARMASGTSYTPSCAGTTCTYGQSYGDGSYTYGFFATETLTLSPTDTIDNVQFGCGQDNMGRFGSADGLIGLGRNAISLVEQTANEFGEYFSYCLPDTSSSAGYLSFGNNGNSSSSAVFTPMLTLAYPAYYGIGVVGISVGGEQLPISPTVFSNASTIIDSGTTFTYLPRTAYDALRDAFRQDMSNYTMTLLPYSGFDTCYDFSNYDYDNVSIPDIAFMFGGGATVNLVGSNILYLVSNTVACLAFIGNDNDEDMGIYGNTQQMTFEVIHHLPGSKIGFAPNGC